MHFVEVVVGGILGSEALGGSSWPSHVLAPVLRASCVRGREGEDHANNSRCTYEGY